MQQLTIENNRPTGIKEDGTKLKYYSEVEIKNLLEKLRIKLGLFGLYDESYPDKWFKELMQLAVPQKVLPLTVKVGEVADQRR